MTRLPVFEIRYEDADRWCKQVRRENKYMKKLSFKVVIPQIILALVCIASAVWGIQSTQSLKAQSLAKTEENINAIHSLDTLSGNFQAMQKILLTHAISGNDDDMAAAKEKVDVIVAEVEAEKANYAKMLSGEEEKKIYKTFEEKYESLLTVYNEAIVLSTNYEKGDAMEMAKVDVNTIAVEMEEIIDSLIELRQNSTTAFLEEQTDAFDQSITMNTMLIAVSVVISILAILSCYMTIVSPTKKSIKSLKHIIHKLENNQFNLNERISVRSKDEIGQLVQGMNSFIGTLQGVIGDISNGSSNLEHVITDVTDSVNSVNNSSRSVSDVMEQLAASMEEVSATISTIEEHVTAVGSNITDFAKSSGYILDYSQEMQQRAEVLEKKAVESQDTASNMVGEMVSNLKLAMEHSRSVEQVESLTNDILSISSQTNLLALNASIEAARAGEAGKGFAVVADEIRQLADNSRETANNIQKINEIVIDAVNELNDSANKMVEFIHENILPDYDAFVDSGRKYNQDAIYVNNEMSAFSQKAESINEVTARLVESIEQISQVVEDSAMSVDSAAKGTVELTAEIQKIQKDMDISEEVALQMKNQCERFENA